MKRMPVQVYILSGSQALFQTVSIMMMAVGGLAGQMLAPSPELATLPIAAAGLGTLLTIFPASLWMSRAGRRAGFLTGTAAGVVAGMAATAGLYLHSFTLLCAATFLIGIYQAFAQYYRFAAVEVAGSSAGSAAISLVLAGGVWPAWPVPGLREQEVLSLRSRSWVLFCYWAWWRSRACF